MNFWKVFIPVLAMLVTFSFASADEKKAKLSYYFLKG
jgi:hypothetical protein